MTARADNEHGTRLVGCKAGAFFSLGASYVLAPGATLEQLLGDASALLCSAAGAYASLELADDAQFAVLHLMRQASSVTAAAVVVQNSGASRLAAPVEFFKLGAAYAVKPGAEFGALVGDAYFLAISALGVLDERDLESDAEFAVRYLLHQACAVLCAAHELTNRVERPRQSAAKAEGHAR